MHVVPTINSRADAMQRILGNFPEDLIALNQWVLWQLVKRGERHTKVPFQPSGRKADTTDPKTWSSAKDVMVAFAATTNFSGIGFVFAADDPYVGIDLDKCRDPETGHVEPWAVDVLARIETYAEISPSGKGFHLIGRAKLPNGGRRKDQIEMYESGRYFTVTGDRYGGSKTAGAADIQHSLAALHSDVFRKSSKSVGIAKAANEPTLRAVVVPSSDEDQAVIDRITASGDAARFAEFRVGNWSALGHASQSEGDLALAGLLARHAGNQPAQIDRMFRSTGMFRDKWDEMRGPSTYGEITITKALNDILNDPVTQFIGQMNERFAVITNGNQVKILDERSTGGDFALLSRTDFALVTSNVPSPGKAAAAQVWLNSRDRREYDGIVFSPEKDVPRRYNIWRGFSVAPRAGDCSIFWQLVREAICSVLISIQK